MGIDVQSDHHHSDTIRSDALMRSVLIKYSSENQPSWRFFSSTFIFPDMQMNISKTRLKRKNSLIQCGISVFTHTRTGMYYSHLLQTNSMKTQWHVTLPLCTSWCPVSTYIRIGPGKDYSHLPSERACPVDLCYCVSSSPGSTCESPSTTVPR